MAYRLPANKDGDATHVREPLYEKTKLIKATEKRSGLIDGSLKATVFDNYQF